jgi:N-acetylglucosamine-6-phosphate deacetylase
MDVAIRCKGVDRIAMITDLTMAGCEDGEYERGVFGDIPIVIKDGVARIKGSNELQDNTMAGSTMMQNVGVKNVLKLGYSWPEAFRMASLTPARIAGCIKTKGSLEITKDADVIVVDENVNVKATYVRGNLLYRA